MTSRTGILVVTAMMATTVLAGSASIDDDAAWRQSGWTATTESDPRQFLHTRTRSGDEGAETLSWRFLLDSAQLSAWHSTPGGNVTELLDLRLESVVEFRDVDGDGRFSLGDALVETHRIEDVQVRYLHSNGGTPGEAEFRLQGAWPATLRWEFDLPAGALTTDQTAFRTTLRVSDYAFNSDNHTYLAVGMRSSDGKLGSGPALVLAGPPLASHLTWRTGNETLPAATFQSYGAQDGREALLALSMPRGQAWEADLAHDVHKAADPTTAERLRELLGNPWLFLGGLVLTLALLYGAYRMALRSQEAH